jgi:phosphate acetyltransferase
MKGSLHTDELMTAVVARESGIRTARRISHCFIMDVPSHPEPLIITDAAVNIAPDLDAKVDIIQNAIDLAHAMGLAEVRVAILSAMETVTAKAPSTIEAAALSKMVDRGQITGAFVDGPFALDNAISPEAAAIKKIVSPVAGRANVLVVPDSRPATCWRRACPSSRRPTRRASCSARGRRSSSRAAPIL